MILTKQNLLPTILPFLPTNPVIVEAGTFDGRDTLRMAHFWPDATIHAFEPVPEIFTMLESNTRQLSNVHRYQLALSDCTGEQSFNISSHPDKPEQPFQAGTLLTPAERLQWSKAEYKRAITVNSITLDEWAIHFGIARVDFLWLDLQGHELAVLKTATNVLKHVQVIYTEVNLVSAYHEQAHWHEMRTWLERQGFTLLATDFDETQPPRWFFGNALFVKKR